MNNSQYIRLEPVGFDSTNPERTGTGRLEYVRGWKMESGNTNFGGVSSMLALPDNRFVMLSDTGFLIGFTLDEESGAALRSSIAPLPDGPEPESRFATKTWDSESMLHDTVTGRYWVGYEHDHSIWRYSASFARKETGHRVKAMQKWPPNGGAEAMLRVPGGEGAEDRFLVFSEEAEYRDGAYQALIFDSDPAVEGAEPKLFGYRPPEGYVITDAALLPDGRALLLHRRFTVREGVSAIVSIGDLSQIEAGAIWSGEPIATLKPPITVDNMEAIAVTVEGDDTIIWIASDDNFNMFQETLLMKFRLLPDDTGKNEKAKATPALDPALNMAPKAKAEASPGFSSIP